jgi:hypothetical protein
VLFVKPRYWVIIDDLTGVGEHDIELRFQFAPKLVQQGPGLWVAASGRRGDGLWLSPFVSAALTGRVVQGKVNPTEGWLSTHYGRRQPAPAVVYAARLQLPARIVTPLVPVDRMTPVPPRVEVLLGADFQAIGLRFPDVGDVVRIDDDTVEVERPERMADVPDASAELTVMEPR